MTKKLRRWGSYLTIVAMAAFLWGCGNSVTGVDDDRQALQTTSTDTPTGGDDQDDGWW